jgi:hypothetical protein
VSYLGKSVVKKSLSHIDTPIPALAARNMKEDNQEAR